MDPQAEYRRIFVASLRILADRVESGAEKGRASQFYYHEAVLDADGNELPPKVAGLSLVIHMGDQNVANDVALLQRLADLKRQADERANAATPSNPEKPE